VVWKLAVEIVILWACYALYMAVLVHRRGPIGGIFFYPKVVQERAVSLGLITAEQLRHRRAFAYALLIAWMLLIPMAMILLVNKARSFWDCAWQYYVLFLGAEFFDWLVIDTVWVALSDWWRIPGAEDLEHTWHSPRVKRWKMLGLIPAAIPLAAVAGGIYRLVGML